MGEKSERADKSTGLVGYYSKFLGISREGLKFYEQKGILHSDRNIENGYRNYNWNEIRFVLQCKKYRHLGFTLNKIASMARQSNTGSILEQFQSQRKILLKEIEEKKRVLIALDDKISQFDAVLKQKEFCVVRRPALYWFPTRRNGIALDSERHPMNQHWIALLPQIDGIIVWPVGTDDISEGHMIEEKFAKGLSFKDAQYLPAVSCAYAVKELVCDKVDKGNFFSQALFGDLLARMKENKFEPTGDATGLFVRNFVDEDDRYHALLGLCIPFAGKHKKPW
jgi:DNA-binding transcriptional MerR regulator